MTLSVLEAEILCLEGAAGSLDELVNHALFSVEGKDPDCTVVFHDSIHQRLFNVLLVDFLKPMSGKFTGTALATLDCLKSICDAPNLNPGGAANLQRPVSALFYWLNTEVEIHVYLPSIHLDTDIKIIRREFLDICGNIGKHNFTRLTRIAGRLQCIFKRNGKSITEEDALLALDDFYERFHTDILGYHGTALAELLNDMRWGIHEYLSPEFARSYTADSTDPGRDIYKYPVGVTSLGPRQWYWSLMNRVRAKPFVPRFKGTHYLKLRY